MPNWTLVTQYQIIAEPVFVPPTAVTPSFGWFQALSEPSVKTKPGLPTASQQFLAENPANPADFIPKLSSWMGQWIEPAKRYSFPAQNQQVLALNPLPLVAFSWFENLSDPVRTLPSLRTGLQQTLAFNPQPFVSFGWFENLSESIVKTKPRLLESIQQSFITSTQPFVPFSWFENLSEPIVKSKRRLLESDQLAFVTSTKPFVSFGWYGWLTEPVRIKPGLRVSLQQTTAINFPVPVTYSVALNVTEIKDIFFGSIFTYINPVSAYVDIHEDWGIIGYGAISSPVPQLSANVNISEVTTTPSSGTPISPVAGANVSIREV